MQRYPRLDYARFVHPNLNVEETLTAQVLEKSHGEQTMSDKDVKLAIVSLLCTCDYQQKLIDELVACVNELRAPKPKKPWYHRL